MALEKTLLQCEFKDNGSGICEYTKDNYMVQCSYINQNGRCGYDSTVNVVVAPEPKYKSNTNDRQTI